ncbi:UNKNOWN [Stylonychia lemnae]|uniref:Uncharacterized protein n=1 Tax=Stylonychia lemnae TaxID=5949 RepID=A0A078ASH9_STYLE|nr:UNKNOWN [Stylonychia lemnae]|eukprot:CDW84951.1 UNKNOWN [Stylonychia lemnae]
MTNRKQAIGLLLLTMLVMAQANSFFEPLKTKITKIAPSKGIRLQAFDPKSTPDLINNAKDAVDGYLEIAKAGKEAADIAGKLAVFEKLSGALGIAGALVGFIFAFIGTGPDPEILKLQEMIKETQSLVVLGNDKILSAIRKLNSQEAIRSASEAVSILDTLVNKHMSEKIEFDVGGYDVLPCGPAMTLCNNAFIDLTNKMDDILSASFEEQPRGDKERVGAVADNLMMLLSNAMYSLTWLNAQQWKASHPNEFVAPEDTAKIQQLTQALTLKHYYQEHAVGAYANWMRDKKFSTCRLCQSCGGDYPTYGGEGYKEYDWGWWDMFRDSCTAELFGESGPPKLCCSVQDPPLKFCSSCGGDYPFRVGRKLNVDDWGTWNRAGGNCKGSFEKTLDEFEICARDRRQCKMCAGQCQANYSQIGYIQRRDDWGMWKVFDTQQCNPDYTGDLNIDKSADVSFCCLDEVV